MRDLSLHGFTNPMEYEPCGFLGDTKSAVSSQELIPFLQLQSIQIATSHLSKPRGILKNRTRP